MLWKIYRWLSPESVDGGGVADADAGAGDGAGGDVPPEEPGLEDGALKADDAEPTEEGGGEKGKKVPGWQKRINELTRRNKEHEATFKGMNEKYQAMESMVYHLLNQLQTSAAPPPAPAPKATSDLPPELQAAIAQNPQAKEAFDLVGRLLDHKLQPLLKDFKAFQGQTQEQKQRAEYETGVQYHQSNMIPIISRVIAKEAADFNGDDVAERFIATMMQAGLEKTLFSDRTWNTLPDPIKWQRFEAEVSRHVSQAVALLKQRDTGLLKRGSKKTTDAGNAVPASAKVPGGASPVANEKQQEILRDLAAKKITPEEASGRLVDLKLAEMRGGG